MRASSGLTLNQTKSRTSVVNLQIHPSLGYLRGHEGRLGLSLTNNLKASFASFCFVIPRENEPTDELRIRWLHIYSGS